jgi:hypothetical protein
MEIMYINVLIGLFAGMLRSVIGWLESGKDFDLKLLGLTLVRTGILGVTLALASTQDPINTFLTVYFADSLISKSKDIESEIRTTTP